VNPSVNHPQVKPAAFMRSPMFLPVICTKVPVSFAQSSKAAGGLPIMLPLATQGAPPGELTFGGIAPAAWPEAKFIAPGIEGPKVEPKWLSLSPKCWA
jgi:hypothetical protein